MKRFDSVRSFGQLSAHKCRPCSGTRPKFRFESGRIQCQKFPVMRQGNEGARLRLKAHGSIREFARCRRGAIPIRIGAFGILLSPVFPCRGILLQLLQWTGSGNGERIWLWSWDLIWIYSVTSDSSDSTAQWSSNQTDSSSEETCAIASVTSAGNKSAFSPSIPL